MKPLPRRQRETLDFIRAYTAQHNRPPFYTHIAAHLNVNPSVAARYVKRLEAKGYVTTGIRVLEQPS